MKPHAASYHADTGALAARRDALPEGGWCDGT